MELELYKKGAWGQLLPTMSESLCREGGALSERSVEYTPRGKLTQIQQARLFSHGKAGGGPPVRGRLP